ncbi:hypothetical protein IJT93_08685 [bacterium]|nr:hypothetical protein [bacterium]
MDFLKQKKDELFNNAEAGLRVMRLKNDVGELKKEKDELLKAIAIKVYEQFVQGKLADPELQAACQQVKLKQWEIDEKWAEINRVKSEKV